MADELSKECLGVTSSVKGRNWRFRYDPALLESYSARSNLPLITSALLLGRNVDVGDAEDFLSPTLKKNLPNPSSLQDMDKAAGLILDHIRDGKRITLFSDYDVDGGTSAAQLIRWGRGLDYEFGLYVPDRVKEGYGPSEAAFESLKSDKVDLVVTLDCGAAAHGALKYAAQISLPVIVIDHHQMGPMPPPALALVNPNRLDDTSEQGHLAAAGVTFLLLVALQREVKNRGLENSVDIRSLLGLTALGTVCDVVPLRGVNRTFVRQGLKVLSSNQNIGVQALADVANTQPPYTTYDAGFVLGPRINAGGRIGRADMGADLLSTQNSQLAYTHAAELDRVNNKRRLMQDRILAEALEAAEQEPDSPVIIVAMEDWHPGIIGIVAGRLKDRFRKPSIVIGIDRDAAEPIAKGSGRSISGVDLGSAISAAKDSGLLISGGGHAMAGGLSIAPHKINAFREFITAALFDDVTEALKNDSTRVDFLLGLSAVNADLMAAIESVGPYGAGNPQPVFAFSDLSVSYAQKTKGDHVRFTLTDRAGGSLSGICFRAGESGLAEPLLTAGSQRFHALGQLKSNVWQGRARIDFHLMDLAYA